MRRLSGGDEKLLGSGDRGVHELPAEQLLDADHHVGPGVRNRLVQADAIVADPAEDQAGRYRDVRFDALSHLARRAISGHCDDQRPSSAGGWDEGQRDRRLDHSCT